MKSKYSLFQLANIMASLCNNETRKPKDNDPDEDKEFVKKAMAAALVSCVRHGTPEWDCYSAGMQSSLETIPDTIGDDDSFLYDDAQIEALLDEACDTSGLPKELLDDCLIPMDQGAYSLNRFCFNVYIPSADTSVPFIARKLKLVFPIHVNPTQKKLEFSVRPAEKGLFKMCEPELWEDKAVGFSLAFFAKIGGENGGSDYDLLESGTLCIYLTPAPGERADTLLRYSKVQSYVLGQTLCSDYFIADILLILKRNEDDVPLGLAENSANEAEKLLDALHRKYEDKVGRGVFEMPKARLLSIRQPAEKLGYSPLSLSSEQLHGSLSFRGKLEKGQYRSSLGLAIAMNADFKDFEVKSIKPGDGVRRSGTQSGLFLFANNESGSAPLEGLFVINGKEVPFYWNATLFCNFDFISDFKYVSMKVTNTQYEDRTLYIDADFIFSKIPIEQKKETRTERVSFASLLDEYEDSCDILDPDSHIKDEFAKLVTLLESSSLFDTLYESIGILLGASLFGTLSMGAVFDYDQYSFSVDLVLDHFDIEAPSFSTVASDPVIGTAGNLAETCSSMVGFLKMLISDEKEKAEAILLYGRILAELAKSVSYTDLYPFKAIDDALKEFSSAGEYATSARFKLGDALSLTCGQRGGTFYSSNHFGGRVVSIGQVILNQNKGWAARDITATISLCDEAGDVVISDDIEIPFIDQDSSFNFGADFIAPYQEVKNFRVELKPSYWVYVGKKKYLDKISESDCSVINKGEDNVEFQVNNDSERDMHGFFTSLIYLNDKNEIIGGLCWTFDDYLYSGTSDTFSFYAEAVAHGARTFRQSYSFDIGDEDLEAPYEYRSH